MSSNIDIKKKCKWCEQVFTAHKMSTSYCSHRCASLAYKERVRQERIISYQKELSLKTGIPQADISRIENGTRNPSLSTLKKLAQGLGMQLRLEFIPDSAKKV